MTIGDLIILGAFVIFGGAMGAWTVGIGRNPTYKKAIVVALLSMVGCCLFIWLFYIEHLKFLDIVIY